MPIINSGNIFGLIARTLSRVDPRLVDHGKRVAYLTVKMLDMEGRRSAREKRDICFLALLHDVGAYKTDEIDRMMTFESNHIWGHSIYGYLFLKYLSPIRPLAPAILFHHTPYEELRWIDTPEKDLAGLIDLADRVDVLTQTEGRSSTHLHGYLRGARGVRFSEEAVDLFLEADRCFHLEEVLRRPPEIGDFEPEADLSPEEIDAYLMMLVYSIDFRSQHTVTHTITTVTIAVELARMMGLSAEESSHVRYGAMLHDLGKIGIPEEILEFPGKLSAQAMAVMRTHVDITEDILGGAIDPVTANISLRHHEKLDGSGYPRGLRGSELTLPERIVAVADMASALLGTRSYKEAYSTRRTLDILRDTAGKGLIDGRIVALLTTRIVQITDMLHDRYIPVLALYRQMDEEFRSLYQNYAR